MQGSSDVLYGTEPPDKNGTMKDKWDLKQNKQIEIDDESLKRVIESVNCDLIPSDSEPEPSMHIIDPVNLNPAQSGNILMKML